MNLPATELAAALALFVGAPVACAIVCLWALRSTDREPDVSRARSDASPIPGAVATLAPPPRRLAPTKRTGLKRLAPRARPRVDLSRWRERRAAARAERDFLSCFDADEQAALDKAFAETLAAAEQSAGAQVHETLVRLRDDNVALTVVSPPHGAGDAVLLVFADATALVADPLQRDAARLLAAELWVGPVVLDGFTAWDGHWTLRFLTATAIMPLPVRRLLPG